ncbi:unnamed protein product [Leptidea sinapis]|uniref:Uncharacterized protein n=1 Tax=Leptidea sinapis TaxID=189913 RepID=A0A5E4Q9U8_9NEOP|nr:unnamed protein product [Leptidea sinapis]
MSSGTEFFDETQMFQLQPYIPISRNLKYTQVPETYSKTETY